ncbi:carboxypeptidase-like regulatory domain-containing protein [Riemerella columbina]|uniref:carboxypeptidase-like regulatory domain-containing protein n=1 Tax=Riemerella columbina TaxID=103810 RepID=UPI00047551B0|nr:carboxypeptidase-like regulatory domain-containing protein [Riemerella columbina]
MQKLLLFCIGLLSMMYCPAQQLSGKVTDDTQNPIENATVVNITQNKITTTNAEGGFALNAQLNDRIRIVKNGYERIEYHVTSFKYNIYKLQTLVREIEEVKIKVKATGNLVHDVKQFPENKKLKTLKTNLYQDYKTKSTATLAKDRLEHLPTFTQPKVDGISLGKIENRWELIDAVKAFQDILGEDYFQALGISKMNQDRFIFFVLKDFETKEILKYGRINPDEVTRFMIKAEEVKANFK